MTNIMKKIDNASISEYPPFTLTLDPYLGLVPTVLKGIKIKIFFKPQCPLEIMMTIKSLIGHTKNIDSTVRVPHASTA